jgi:hypothetical protein
MYTADRLDHLSNLRLLYGHNRTYDVILNVIATAGNPEHNAMLIGYKIDTANGGTVLHIVEQKDHRQLMLRSDAGPDVVLVVLSSYLALMIGLNAPAGIIACSTYVKVLTTNYNKVGSRSGPRLLERVG